jgi:Transposase and inactivated derivatives
VIKANLHKYSVSAMCKVLKISRSTYYYEAKQRIDEWELTASIIDIFKASRNNYGTRKIKKELANRDMSISRRRIGRIMKQEGLVSSYTTAQFHPLKDTCNESKVVNVVNREFDGQPYRNVVVSDLTYVRVGLNWNYICVLVDLFNREIIGYSAGLHKTAKLVKEAFMTVSGSLNDVEIFHTDRGNEFKNQLIEKTLEAFKITRSLSHKGCPYDNAVAEATFKIIKTEFVKNQTFTNLADLKLQLSDYVNWFNNHRIHSSLGYLTPVMYRMNTLKKVV